MRLASVVNLVGLWLWGLGILFLVRDLYRNSFSPSGIALVVAGFVLQLAARFFG